MKYKHFFLLKTKTKTLEHQFLVVLQIFEAQITGTVVQLQAINSA
jgi:hypothetical protein